MSNNMATSLLVSKSLAIELLEKQIENGKSLFNLKIETEEDIRNAKRDKKKWTNFNKELLVRLFDTDEYSRKYSIPKPVGIDIRELDTRIEYFNIPDVTLKLRPILSTIFGIGV